MPTPFAAVPEESGSQAMQDRIRTAKRSSRGGLGRGIAEGKWQFEMDPAALSALTERRLAARGEFRRRREPKYDGPFGETVTVVVGDIAQALTAAPFVEPNRGAVLRHHVERDGAP